MTNYIQTAEIYAAREAVREGQLVSFYGMVNLTLEALDRALRLQRRFGWDPMDYLYRWSEFQLEKQRDQIQ